MSVQETLAKSGPRKLLALDGGGVRGVMTLEVLLHIESTLQQLLGSGDDFVLADYFDYVAGTSTGAIIATCLALGMRVKSIRELYHNAAREMFDRTHGLSRLRSKYAGTHLTRLLRDEIGLDATLGSDRLQTLLMLVMRNATTDSPWPVSNNPRAMFNALDSAASNLRFPLWQLVRASTAAPTYFPPEVIDVGGQQFVFVDGGVTVYNNPAFQLFLMATIEPYRLCWTATKESMLLVSVGSGIAARSNEKLRPKKMSLLYDAVSVPAALIFSATQEQDFLCRVFGDCLVGDEVDAEVGDMREARGPLDRKLFTYLRYNADLSAVGLARLGLPDIDSAAVQALDASLHIEELCRIGACVARQVNPEHYTPFGP